MIGRERSHLSKFTQGSRYTDYVPSTDKVAAYGIGGLIAGGIAQKLGLFALAVAFLKKGWVLIVLALRQADREQLIQSISVPPVCDHRRLTCGAPWC
jgi:uncharacterized membrane-anchored protein